VSFVPRSLGAIVSAVALAGAVALSPGVASADEHFAPPPNDLSKIKHRSFESPQWFALELRLSPFSPSVDTEPGLSGTPFQDTFGSNPRVLAQFELDFQFLRIPWVGSLGIGASAGYFQIGQKAPTSDGTLTEADAKFETIPFYFPLVLRADVFLRKFQIPIVPYVKLGGGVAMWRSFTDAGNSSVNGVEGKGTSYGLHFAAGGALELNWLDRGAAKSIDNALGINHTYAFAEYMLMNYDGFGSPNVLRAGGQAAVFGLAFEF
jgi:hypothetical protein